MKRMSRLGRLFAAAVFLAGSSFPNHSHAAVEPVGSTVQSIGGESTPQDRHRLPPEPVSIALLGTVLLCGAVIVRRRMA